MEHKTALLGQDVMIILNHTDGFPDDEDVGFSSGGSGDDYSHTPTPTTTPTGHVPLFPDLVPTKSTLRPTGDTKTAADEDSSNFHLTAAMISVGSVIAVFIIVFLVLYCRKKAKARKNKNIRKDQDQRIELATVRTTDSRNNGIDNRGISGPTNSIKPTTISPVPPQPLFPSQPLKARPLDCADNSIPEFLCPKDRSKTEWY